MSDEATTYSPRIRSLMDRNDIIKGICMVSNSQGACDSNGVHHVLCFNLTHEETATLAELTFGDDWHGNVQFQFADTKEEILEIGGRYHCALIGNDAHFHYTAAQVIGGLAFNGKKIQIHGMDDSAQDMVRDALAEMKDSFERAQGHQREMMRQRNSHTPYGNDYREMDRPFGQWKAPSEGDEEAPMF